MKLFILVALILFTFFIALFLDNKKEDNDRDKQEFLNHLLYMYPESYDSTNGMVTVKIADETIYGIYVNSADNYQQVSTVDHELFRRTVDQLQENHINVSLSKNSGIYSVHWKEKLFVPDLRSEKPVIMKVVRPRKIKEEVSII